MSISADLRHWVLYLKPALNLQLQLKPGMIGLACGRTARLSGSPHRRQRIATGGLIRTASWELRGPPGMMLRWPHLPSAMRTGRKEPNIADAVGIATVPLPDAGGHADLELRIRSRSRGASNVLDAPDFLS
jgi:hypothetical protein